MPIFRILNLGNEVPNLVFEFQNALVFLGLMNRAMIMSAPMTISDFRVYFFVYYIKNAQATH